MALLILVACVPNDPVKRANYYATLEAKVDTCAEGAAVELISQKYSPSRKIELVCGTGCLVTTVSAGTGWGGSNVSTDISCPNK